MNQIKKFEKDALVRKNFKSKELSIILYKYGTAMNTEKRIKTFFYFNLVRKFHLNWSSARVVNKCLYSGRTNWPLRRFRLSRMMFKNMFDENEGITGVKRSSW